MRLAPLALLLALASAACAGFPRGEIEPPEVTIAGLGFGQPGLFEQELRLDLRVRNPNDFTVEIDSVSFGLEVNALQFARGRTGEAFTLPALGETVVPVTIAVPTSDLVERIAELGIEQRLDYRLTGVAEVGGPLGSSLPVPFQREGKLALPRIPGLTAPGS